MIYRVKVKSEIVEWEYHYAQSKEHFIELMEEGEVPEKLEEIEIKHVKTYWDTLEEVG